MEIGNYMRRLMLVLVMLTAYVSTAGAATYGKGLILTCPHCHKDKVIKTMMSGNTFGARYWSDQKLEARFWQRASFVQHCPSCKKYFTIYRMSMKNFSETDRGRDFGDLTFEEWKEAMAQFSVVKPRFYHEELVLREHFMRAFNTHYSRQNTVVEIPDSDWQLFMESARLMVENFHINTEIEDRMLKIEALREMAMYKQCLKEAKKINREELDGTFLTIYDGIISRAKAKDSRVFRIPSDRERTDDGRLIFGYPGHEIKKEDGSKYIIAFKKEKVGENEYTERVNAFIEKGKEKTNVSAFDGGDNVEGNVELQIRYKQDYEEIDPVIRYDWEQKKLYIPIVDKKGRLTNRFTVYSYDGNKFVKI